MKNINTIAAQNTNEARVEEFAKLLGLDVNKIDVEKASVAVRADKSQATMYAYTDARMGMTPWVHLEFEITLRNDGTVKVVVGVTYNGAYDSDYEKEVSDLWSIESFQERAWEGSSDGAISWFEYLEDPMEVIEEGTTTSFEYKNESCPFRY